MPKVLHITAAGHQYWEKSAAAWSPCADPGNAAVWVVTDLTEESVTEVNVPRLFGADRSRYIDRQLSARYPETEFRTALSARGGPGLLQRLAPPLQTLTGVEPPDRIRAALQELKAPLAGVWSVSMLLTQLGQRGNLPANLFVVHCQSSAMRIIYLKDRAPMLTRLVAIAQSASEQASEIIRTIRHLENTRVIDRGSQRFAALLLGGSVELAQALAKDRLDALPPPPAWAALADDQSNDVLFDMVCKSPAGQLAPLQLRASYLANNVARTAKVLSALSLAIAVWISAGSIQTSVQARNARQQVEAQLAQMSNEIAQVDRSIESFGVSPDLVRNALAIDEHEISSAPDLRVDLMRLSGVIAKVPDARVRQLQWRLLDAATAACPLEGAVVADTNPTGSEQTPPPAQRKVEIQMSVALAAQLGPQQLAQQAETITRGLSSLQGSNVLQDPARTLREGDIRVGIQSGESQDLHWCISLAVPATTTGAMP